MFVCERITERTTAGVFASMCSYLLGSETLWFDTYLRKHELSFVLSPGLFALQLESIHPSSTPS